jgi:hypothetical protein
MFKRPIVRSGNRDQNHAEVQNALSSIGMRCVDTSGVGSSHIPGFPDIVGYFRGRLLWYEVKGEGESLTLAEKKFHAMFPDGSILVVRSGRDAIEQTYAASGEKPPQFMNFGGQNDSK